ncbi:hypothetical protein PR048_006428 [Dryococelus australis]|uniref:Uncharacterized protein n=1 Tax=Dryococelus australis TaxID=614101 RepID=A0ABQ9IBL5_9NEOP|nr:hypothetical protein PR048_006428 [Dryococelus australis]
MNKRFVEEGQVIYKPTKLISITFKCSYFLIYEHYFDVKPKIQRVIQCAKCYCFGNFDQICHSNKLCCPQCGEDHTLTDCSVPVYCCLNCSDHCELWTLELDIKHLMATNNLTYR